MMIHSVYFWLRDDLTEAQRRQFTDGLASLLTIDTVRHGYVGTPAETPPRPIIDSSYDYALVTVFDDLAAHDAYQVDPVHDAFRELAPLWTKVQIYDTTVTASS